MIYCVDTSSLIAAWQERYPIENFPKFWDRMDGLVKEGRLISPIEVFNEIEKRSDDLHDWLRSRRDGMFRELDDEVQIEVANVLQRFPRLVGDKKLRTSADPFVIALARITGHQLVTEEKPTGSLNRPNIPDVCAQLALSTIGILQVIQREKWVAG
ncbi:MAG: DUF4411 family protein [Acidobacteriaceae bacterium]